MSGKAKSIFLPWKSAFFCAILRCLFIKQMAGNQAREKLWNADYLKVLATNFLICSSFMLIAPLLPLYLQEEFGADKDTIGIVLSGYTITALVIRLFSGYIVDTFSRKTVLLLALGFFACFFAGYLLAGTLLLFAIIRTLHGAPFGISSVAISTVAIDVLPSSKRTEGIGYYGLSNNIATAISPSIALIIFGTWSHYSLLFIISLLLAFAALATASCIRIPRKEQIKNKQAISLDRFILVKGWSQSLTMICFSFSYGIVSTYIALYGKEELGITNGTGLFFALLAGGLILSRLTGGPSLRKGKIARNASIGILVSLVGYLVFAGLHSRIGYYGAALIIGLGNGHMYPAFQNIFIDLATNEQRGTANSTLLVSWDLGVGIGIMTGGIVSHFSGFHGAFWTAWIVNGIGALLFFLYSKRHYLRHRLR